MRYLFFFDRQTTNKFLNFFSLKIGIYTIIISSIIFDIYPWTIHTDTRQIRLKTSFNSAISFFNLLESHSVTICNLYCLIHIINIIVLLLTILAENYKIAYIANTYFTICTLAKIFPLGVIIYSIIMYFISGVDNDYNYFYKSYSGGLYLASILFWMINFSLQLYYTYIVYSYTKYITGISKHLLNQINIYTSYNNLPNQMNNQSNIDMSVINANTNTNTNQNIHVNKELPIGVKIIEKSEIDINQLYPYTPQQLNLFKT